MDDFGTECQENFLSPLQALFAFDDETSVLDPKGKLFIR